MAIITIIGAGMMGAAMSVPASDNGHLVRLVGTPLDKAIIDVLRTGGAHPGYDRHLPSGISLYQIEEVKGAIADSDVIVGGVSSFGVDWFSREILPLIPQHVPVLSVTKGLRDMPDGTLVSFPQLLDSCLPEGRHLSLNAVGGPCISFELIDRNQTEVVFCGKDAAVLKKLRELFETDYYHISTSRDVVGVECVVAMKNAYALGISLAIGINERLHGEGSAEAYNPQAALFGQSIQEISHILKLVGGNQENIKYAAGDLYVTVFGGRTRKIGALLGRGLRYAEAKEELKGVTLESVAIVSAVARAIRVQSARGSLSLDDFPLLMHMDEIINQERPVDIPWKRFETTQS